MQHQAPPTGSRTLCELQCRLVTVPAEGKRALAAPACPDIELSAAGDAPGVQQGYAPVVKCPSGQWPPSYDQADGSWDSRRAGSGGGSLRSLLRQLAARLPGGAAARLERLLGLQAAEAPGAPLAWHPRQPLLAAVDSCGRVQVFDFAGQLPWLAHGAAGSPPPPLQPALVLQHEFQQSPGAAAWRPHGGRCLAVGSQHGVCLWHLSRPPIGSGSRSDSSAWMTWLQAPGAGPVTTLAWHPQGHLLAAACADSPGFHVWDVATGTATRIAAGPEAVSILRWSPCGTYLLAAHPAGDFRIWQTQTWWSQRWAAAEGGGEGGAGCGLAEACWAPDSRSLLLAYEHSPQLVSLHLTGKPPSLQAQLLPLPLAELNARGVRGSTSASGPLIQAVAWDPRAQRLAVALGGAHPAAGSVALYDTRCDPILSARFIGLVALSPLAGSRGKAAGPSRGAAAEAGWEEIQPEEVAEAAGAVGGGARGAGTLAAGGAVAGGASAAAAVAPGGRPQLAFMPGFAQGALLAAQCNDFVATIPMFFA
ncbi:hypothetical protein ABPG75_006433 [Micractinium tetrahymenae]